MSDVALSVTPVHEPVAQARAVAAGPAREKLYALQILRFLAAFLVFFSHMEDRYDNWEQKYHMVVPRLGLDGQLGVDIFFVISGFVMGYVALGKFGKPGAARRFAIDRVTKIMPLYWALTLLECLVFLASAHLGGHFDMGRLNGGELFKSLFFIPYFNVEGKHRPLLGQGWTLNYEMAFYVVMAASLFLRRAWAAAALTGTFLLVWLTGLFLHPHDAPLKVWSNPIIFEFLLGFYLAMARNSLLAAGRELPRVPGVTLLLVGLIAGHILLFGREAPMWVNAMVGLTTVALCVLTRNAAPWDPIRRGMVRLGDSSYSLYLSHNFTLLAAGVLWRGLFGAAALWAYVPFVIVSGLVAAHLCHLTVEQPGTRLMRRALR